MPSAAFLRLYQEAQINEAMDSGTYVGGTDCYRMPSICEAIAEMEGWTLPERLTYEDMCDILRAQDRADEIEYLMENL
jgi:hypothetical protein